MRTIIKKLILALALLLGTTYLFSNEDYSEHNVSNLRIINEHSIVIDQGYFTDGKVFDRTTRDLFKMVAAQQALKMTTGVIIPIEIAVLSNGGYISFYDSLSGDLHLKDAYIVCTVATAESIAFSFMIEFCDERIMLPKASVMTHHAFAFNAFGAKVFTDSSKRASIRHSDLEAIELNIDRDKWYAISRMQGDKFYSKKEMKEYGIATDFLEE